MSGSVLATLAVGVPSVLVAFISFMYASKARTQTAQVEKDKVDADAYQRARESYEASIATLRSDLSDARGELAGLRDQVTDLRGRLAGGGAG